MKEKIQNFKTKLKENKKFRAQFASVVTACVVVLACAITIPVCMHNSNVKKTLAVEPESSTNDVVSTETNTSTETTTEATTAETTTAEMTTVEITEPAGSGSSANNGSSTNNGSSSSNKGGSSGSGNSSSNKPTTTKPVTTTKKETTTEDDRWNWTQADVDAAVAEARRYAISKGFAIDSSLTEVGTTWDNPVDTSVDVKTRGVSNLKSQVDLAYNMAIQELGYMPDGLPINIFAKNCGDYWEIYVVH